MDDELEGCIADARIAISAAHDHLTRIEERARRVRAEIETTVRAAVQWEMRERIATAERERDAARAALAATQARAGVVRSALLRLADVRVLRSTCAEGDDWRAHVHVDEWDAAHTGAMDALKGDE